ncbi:nucleotidyl transferase AbiEii/AbiGii toxin family protein [Catellatospora sp. KI3]|uniref:nucleotidyl transferase AbiEii/AbiGii toxin family protein n=1 Tax=Catellatospora sp. KI3 TaxID=3041620 RepID=UPI002482B53F|nr:nucleotidyl transferase AbiEii/AbiGii toxin family protein [Catellatospora sp. KI3]MDI1465193.1 nucleotidyl transferase AbiEii/AbiGii toxin family protein [Catellatospora sp. KI3]
MSGAWRTAQRRAMDHVIALVAASPVGESLLLRGSITMAAWVGGQAREPGDLDWVVRPRDGVPLDRDFPYPYLDRLDHARTWAEAAHGAIRQELWEFEDFDTKGVRVRLPPEGTRWVAFLDSDASQPHADVLDLVRHQPQDPHGLWFDTEGATEAGGWGYAYADDYYYDDAGAGGGGARLLLPWRFEELSGTLQLDFSYCEALPDAPVRIEIPRADGGPPTALWTAGPELSLAWKLRWLEHDSHRGAKGKDLYDAVLLAELDGMRLPRPVHDQLRRRSGLDALRPDAVRSWQIDWPDHLPGTAEHWLARLAAALPRVLDPMP